MSTNGKHYVYVCLDANRGPLYVGCTNNVPRRLREHAGYGVWTDRLAQVLVTEFDTQDEALDAERERIQSLRPQYNWRHNPRRMGYVEAVERHVAYLEFLSQFDDDLAESLHATH